MVDGGGTRKSDDLETGKVLKSERIREGIGWGGEACGEGNTMKMRVQNPNLRAEM